jgi:hypothetical protein
VSPQQAAVTYLGSGTVKTTFAPSVCSMIFSIDFIHNLKVEGGGANWRSPSRWYCPSSTDLAAGMGSKSSSVPRKAEFDIGSITTVSFSVRFNFLKVSHSFPILPDLGTMWPFSAAAFAIQPKLDPPIKTVVPLLCSVSGGGMLRSFEGLRSSPTQNFSFSSVSRLVAISFPSFGFRGGSQPELSLHRHRT